MDINKIPRPEHPEPMWERENWINLNGTWEFEIDRAKSGHDRGYDKRESLDGKITVPFCPESPLSGVGDRDFMAAVWYKKKFTLPESFKGKRTILHIGACDYYSKVWINGEFAKDHIGGYTSYSCDITKYLKDGENIITVYAEDDLRSHRQPSGKQCDVYHSCGCSYTRTTGIWQTVWLEAVPETYIVSAKYDTFLDGKVVIKAKVKSGHSQKLSAKAYFGNNLVAQDVAYVCGEHGDLVLNIEDPKYWAPGEPNLYTLELEIGEDKVNSYFGIRTVGYADHRFYINEKAVFGRFILDQGFYPDGVYTAPTEEALKRDIELSMSCGFNGARLHEKIFEPRFLYWCDKMGYMVWEEHANWGLDIARPESWGAFIPEWVEAVERDYNHPAIIGWCPFNETPNIPDKHLIEAVYSITKAIDTTRPVIDTSGYFHASECDMPDYHNYEQNPEAFAQHLSEVCKENGNFYGNIVPNGNDICFISEFGGIWWSHKEDGWGYGSRVANTDEFLDRYRGLFKVIYDNDMYCALCYTQLTDVEQEQNGLFTFEREAKFDIKAIYEATTQKAKWEE